MLSERSAAPLPMGCVERRYRVAPTTLGTSRRSAMWTSSYHWSYSAARSGLAGWLHTISRALGIRSPLGLAAPTTTVPGGGHGRSPRRHPAGVARRRPDTTSQDSPRDV